MADSIYISFTKYGCEICDTVHNSIWGQPFGIPLAYLGIAGYGLIYVCLKSGKINYGIILAAVGAVTSLLLVAIQAFVLKQYCVFCIISAVTMMTIWMSLCYRQKETRLGRFMSLAPILAALVFAVVVLPYVNNSEQSDNKVSVLDAAGVSQQNSRKETDKILESDPLAAEDKACEAIAPRETAAVSQGAEEVSDRQIVSTIISNEADNTESDSTAETEAGDPVSTEPASSDSENLTTFYKADGSPIKINIDKEYILFFASHCEVCNRALDQVNLMSEHERPILIDIWIPGNSNLENEKQNVESKLSGCSIDPQTVIYDLDRVNPIPKVPRFVNQ